MPPKVASAGLKRKIPFDSSSNTSSARKRQKNQDARAIPVQRNEPMLGANGDLNIASFVKAREFEINALANSMNKARKALSTRAFQQVPRNMRRRTASHNAKKVPRRLRSRAQREMKEDNTPTVSKRTRLPSTKLRLRLDRAKLLGRMNKHTKTVRQRKKELNANKKQTDPQNHVSVSRVPRLKKNILAKVPTATTKYKKRQVNKTWLPTHLWHTKRAHMPRPTEPLWRIAIPLSPTEKSYRPSHRAAGSRGCIAWDASYMSSVSCRGNETTLDGLLSTLGFVPQTLSTVLLKKWKAGSRHAEGWIFERDNLKRPIAPVQVLWIAQFDGEVVRSPSGNQASENKAMGSSTTTKRTKLDRELLIRIHPSAFHQFWDEILKAAKVQKPQVLIEDLRFEIGSIEVQGPGSTEALLGVLQPIDRDTPEEGTHPAIWRSLTGLSNPGSLPQNVILSFDVADPRFNHPPEQVRIPHDNSNHALNQALVSWLPDKSPRCSSLFSHKARWILTNSLPSQKSINRRKALTPPGQAVVTSDKDPHIPIVLLASRAEGSLGGKANNAQGTWTVLLPWRCVELVWRSLMYYPLSSGGTPRFGGLKQQQQLAFELQQPWFPADMPGTEAGKAWENTTTQQRFDEWVRRPPKHRIAWDKIELGPDKVGELGRGWSCDWDFLFASGQVQDKAASDIRNHQPSQGKDSKLLTRRQRKASEARPQADQEASSSRRRNTSSPESEADGESVLPLKPGLQYSQLCPTDGWSLLKNHTAKPLPAQPVLMTIRITLLDRGSPSAAARIYRLPTSGKDNATQSTQRVSGELQEHDQPQTRSSGPTATTITSEPPTKDLRGRWLALIPRTSSSTHVSKQKLNRFGLATSHFAYTRDSLAKVNVLPKNAPQEIIDKYGPDSAFGRGDGEVPKENHKTKSRGTNKMNNKNERKHMATTATSRESIALLAPGANNDADQSSRHLHAITGQNTLSLFDPLNAPSQWELHPPVPEAHDLIGFVTSGGYNLAEGHGTAIGNIWVQRLLEGWTAVDNVADKQAPDTRYLCIVRNAGESIGRLARWEVCGRGR